VATGQRCAPGVNGKAGVRSSRIAVDTPWRYDASIMKQDVKKLVPQEPTPLASPPASAPVLSLELFGFRYQVERVQDELVLDKPEYLRATKWTYYTTSTASQTSYVITLSTDLLQSDVAEGAFPVRCWGVENPLVMPTAETPTQSSRLGGRGLRITCSDGRTCLPQDLDICIRLPTADELVTFRGVGSTRGADVLDSTAATVQKALGFAQAVTITRPACLAVLKAMVELGATSCATAQPQEEILAKAGSKSTSINGLFGTHSGTEPQYNEFKTKHIKNSGNRNGTYYLDLNAVVPSAPAPKG